jgi:hypothetical protein
MAVAVASLRAQSVPAASRVDSLSPVVIELAVKNAVSATTAAYRRDDVAFIPLVTLLTLAAGMPDIGERHPPCSRSPMSGMPAATGAPSG